MRTLRPMLSRYLTLSVVVLSVFAGPAVAEDEASIKARYTKFEYRIPMRDGTKLFTSVYAPKDRSTRYPMLLSRTPYSCRPYGVDRYRGDLGPSDHFSKEGYIFVYQDVRGRWMSEGEFVNMRPIVPHREGSKDVDESTDTYDTIDWLIEHVENHNGRVGMWGISYPGFYTDAGIVDAHPALKAASPQAPVTDWFVGDDWHHNGAFQLPHAFNFLANFGRPRPEPTRKFDYRFDHGTPDGYDFFLKMGPLASADKKYFKGDVAFWNEVMSHGTYDAWWKARNIRTHLKKIKPAVMTVGGWFDAENLFGALETYRAIEASSPGAVNSLVMGPWSHGGWSRGQGASLGSVQFNSKTSVFYAEKIEFPFFQHHLKGSQAAGAALPPEAWVFVTGLNEWRRLDAWPPREARPRWLSFHSGGRLSLETRAEAGMQSTASVYDEYVSDPARPVPFIDVIAIDMKKEYMLADQRFASRRPDVLTYQTDALDEDVTLVGPIEVSLHVSTSGSDSDWMVKLIDVYPDDFPDVERGPAGERMGGYQQLVRGDVMRGKFRNSLERPEPFQPDRPTPVNFKLQDIAHTFRPGHRIMVQIQSTWFPLIDRNPQTFVDIYEAKESDFQRATQRVYRSAEFPTRLKALALP